MKTTNTLIIGAGAAGLMAAGSVKGSVLVIDHNQKPAKKLLVTGGGKCNFSNIDTAPKYFYSQNTHFFKSALAGFKAQDFINILKEHNVSWQEREDGKLFAFNAKDVTDVLLERCNAADVKFSYNTKAYEITPKEDGGFIVSTAAGEIAARNVIVATGGLSMPKLGASSFAYDAASKLGIKLTPRYPALTPFLFNKQDAQKLAPLTGISQKVTITYKKQSVTDDMLFTHYGLSGPAVLKASLFYKGGEEISINFLPSVDVAGLIEAARTTNKNFYKVFAEFMPQRLLKTLISDVDASVANAKKTLISQIINDITAYKITPEPNKSYLKAEITAGGVDTTELSSSTMESRRYKGLYFIGECVDVSGTLGGYNLHWAWASANAAVKSINKNV